MEEPKAQEKEFTRKACAFFNKVTISEVLKEHTTVWSTLLYKHMLYFLIYAAFFNLVLTFTFPMDIELPKQTDLTNLFFVHYS
jgi:hypothetical protein